MDNYYTKSDITSLLEGLSPQQGNITRLNIYDEQDNSKYSYIKCELDRYEEPRIFIPNLYVDDTVEADRINIINEGTVGTLQIMNLDRFSENEPNISVSANLIPANGRETIGNEDHPWNAVYTGDLAVTGDTYFTGAFAVNAIEPYTYDAIILSGDVQVRGDILPYTEISNTLGSEDYRWNGWFEVLNVTDLYVNGEELPFNNYYTKSEVDTLIQSLEPSSIPKNLSITRLTLGELYDGNTRYGVDLEYIGGDLKISGGFEAVNILGQLVVDDRNILDELDLLNEFVENHEDSSTPDVDNILAVLNGGNIHTVSILAADTNSDPLDVRCNKFVKHGDNLTVSVYNNAGELYGYYDVGIYTPSGRDITDSFTITDNSGTFIINNVNQDILISVVMQSAPIPPLNPGLEEPDLGD